MTASANLPQAVLLLSSLTRPQPRADIPDDAGSDLANLSAASFRTIVMEAILRRDSPPVEHQAALPQNATDSPSPGQSPPQSAPTPADGQSLPASHRLQVTGELIEREAQRTGIDPNLLAALRRVENGKPGREFGVLSVSAPGPEDQARLAANTIRNTARRFELQGKNPTDPNTGRYTNEFLRFFSARYAPIGAANDPAGLNRFHAANLIAIYRKACKADAEG
jgi:hypothetical protein